MRSDGDELHVGRVGDDIFIGVTDGLYEKCKRPLSGTNMHAMRFTPDEAEWLIERLREELVAYSEPAALP